MLLLRDGQKDRLYRVGFHRLSNHRFTKSPISLPNFTFFLRICNIFSWTFHPTDDYGEGAQIDLLIDRSDQMINLCEIKFSGKPFLLTKEYDEELRRKMSVFEYATKTRKGISIVIITSYGLVRNAYADNIQNQLTMDDLFVP